MTPSVDPAAAQTPGKNTGDSLVTQWHNLLIVLGREGVPDRAVRRQRTRGHFGAIEGAKICQKCLGDGRIELIPHHFAAKGGISREVTSIALVPFASKG